MAKREPTMAKPAPRPGPRPAFAEEFPAGVAELDALVDAFARGDYRTVRDDAPKLATSAADEAVRRAAKTLRARVEPEPAVVWLIALTGALLVFLSAWWIAHARSAAPDDARPPAPAPAVTIEHVR